MSRFGKLLAGVLLAGCAAFAQDSNQPAPATGSPKHNHMHGDRAEQKLMRLSKRLNLTDDQREKIRPILQDEDKQLTSLESDTSLTSLQKHREMREIRMSSKSQMEDVLTSEQKEKLPSGRTRGEGRHHTPSGRANSGTTIPSSSDPQ